MGEGEGESAAEEGAASWAEGALPLAEEARFRCAGAAGPGCAATGDMRLTLGLWTSTPARERVGLGVAGLAIACACLLPLAGAWSVEGGTWCKGRPGERREARCAVWRGGAAAADVEWQRVAVAVAVAVGVGGFRRAAGSRGGGRGGRTFGRGGSDWLCRAASERRC